MEVSLKYLVLQGLGKTECLHENYFLVILLRGDQVSEGKGGREGRGGLRRQGRRASQRKEAVDP